MNKDIAEKYQLQYMLLMKEFLCEVEKGTEWVNLKPLVHEMKKVNDYLECIEGLVTTPTFSPFAATPGKQ